MRPNFKGVVVVSFLALAFFALEGFASQPYCVYLSQSQELRCDCTNWKFNRSEPSIFPSNDFFVATEDAAKVQQVAAIKLTGCDKLHLTLDLRPLPYPFYR